MGFRKRDRLKAHRSRCGIHAGVCMCCSKSITCESLRPRTGVIVNNRREPQKGSLLPMRAEAQHSSLVSAFFRTKLSMLNSNPLDVLDDRI